MKRVYVGFVEVVEELDGLVEHAEAQVHLVALLVGDGQEQVDVFLVLRLQNDQCLEVLDRQLVLLEHRGTEPHDVQRLDVVGMLA